MKGWRHEEKFLERLDGMSDELIPSKTVQSTTGNRRYGKGEVVVETTKPLLRPLKKHIDVKKAMITAELLFRSGMNISIENILSSHDIKMYKAADLKRLAEKLNKLYHKEVMIDGYKVTVVGSKIVCSKE